MCLFLFFVSPIPTHLQSTAQLDFYDQATPSPSFFLEDKQFIFFFLLNGTKIYHSSIVIIGLGGFVGFPAFIKKEKGGSL